jgi:hypothetical protein
MIHMRQGGLVGPDKRNTIWVFHQAGPVPGGLVRGRCVATRAAFNRFGKKLRPIFKEIGMKGAKPTIFPIARFIKT